MSVELEQLGASKFGFSTDGVVGKVFYPVFPPDENVVQVLSWLA